MSQSIAMKSDETLRNERKFSFQSLSKGLPLTKTKGKNRGVFVLRPNLSSFAENEILYHSDTDLLDQSAEGSIDFGLDTDFFINSQGKKVSKFELVMKSKYGDSSVPEICRQERVPHKLLLDWIACYNKEQQKTFSTSSIPSENGSLHRVSLETLFGKRGREYVELFLDINSESISVLGDKDHVELDGQNRIEKKQCLSLIKTNDVRFINKYFENINLNLSEGGLFVGWVETFQARKKRKRINKVPGLRNLYFSLEFVFKRIIPKLSLTKKLYFDSTKGNDRLLSKAECLGRLVSCGFQIIDFKSFNGKLIFVVKKVDSPKYDSNPSYGPIYKMPRVGKNGNIIKVYKLRTMHPYSEYLQEFIVKAYGYSSSGKPANDFRIPDWGRTIRRFWMDEFPQLINVLKGEMKLVGIRPVSMTYFKDIPKEMQKLRITQKPGCIPPYVALNRNSDVLSVLQAEKDYLEEKIRNPYTTDLSFFFKAIFNIFIRSKRSA